MIYLDANATTPLLPEVLEAMLPWLREGFANPSGAYAGAKLARKAIDQARGQVAELIGADAGEIIFTGGGTESVNTALYSLDRLAGQGTAVVSAIEHSAVLRCAESLTREVARVPVTSGGRLDLDAFPPHGFCAHSAGCTPPPPADHTRSAAKSDVRARSTRVPASWCSCWSSADSTRDHPGSPGRPAG